MVMECRTLQAIGGSILPPETEVIMMTVIEVLTLLLLITEIISLVSDHNKKK